MKKVPEGADDDDHAAHLEQALLQARELIESTVSLHRRRPVAPSAVVRTDVAMLGDALEQHIGRARYSVSVARTGTGEFADTVMRLLPTIPSRVIVRVLCTDESSDPSLARYAQMSNIRVEVRVSESELREILVVDSTEALVRAAGNAGAPATVVNDAAAARALGLLFAGVWARGRGLDEHLQMRPRLRTELARNILEQLGAGSTDETAAHELNVSLRTYRRYVAEIMRELDANSRFQAGARAVELGLLSA
ncbi:DNA-binding response regulator [Streptomyces sp. NBC_01207]|uniref:DNA-binding response regulator n=1 Tax=Streptomyces sp. NBC_01207 TaxID=2903772 RepID=UPI002E0F6EB5|nr:DNA-binding response regulator [Streptomyces sp. NBC_01207]